MHIPVAVKPCPLGSGGINLADLYHATYTRENTSKGLNGHFSLNYCQYLNNPRYKHKVHFSRKQASTCCDKHILTHMFLFSDMSC